MFVTLLVFAASAAEEPARTIEFGGMRRARATVEATDSAFLVKVRLLPVQAFDEVTNRRVTRQKARQLALEAMLRHLTGKRSGELTVEGARVTAIGSDGKFFTLTMEIPRRGISTEAEPAATTVEAPGLVRARFMSRFDRDLQDQLDIARELGASLSEELREIEEKHATPPVREQFVRAVGALEKRGMEQIDLLAERARNTTELSDVRVEKLSPREQVLAAIASVRSEFRDRLATGRQRRDRKPSSKESRE